jgi:hypothetical protein
MDLIGDPVHKVINAKPKSYLPNLKIAGRTHTSTEQE